MRFLFFTLLLLLYLFPVKVYAQGCCSGGSGSPIAGGTSQGVLLERQMELGANIQHVSSNKFMVGNKDTASLFDKLSSNYLYTRIAYGITKDFTLSVESGYYFDKTQIGLDKKEKIKSSGIADLIIFPRYDIYNHTEETKRTEITVGIGYKIPLGTYNDSTVVYTNPKTGAETYTTSPPTVQPTNGSHDIIFYTFLYRGYPLKKFRIFSNMLYMKKGWNPLGQKFGDYASIGLFAGKTLFKNLGLTLQVRGEWIDKMQYDKNVDMLAIYNIDVKSTGSKKVFFVPQLSYNFKAFTIYVLSESPIYQYVTQTQVASQYQFTMGISYRFFTSNATLD